MASDEITLLDKVTLGIALWGAVIATLTAGWSAYRDLVNKGKLRVKCFMGVMATPGVGIDKDNCLIWNITNVGTQPVVLTTIGGRFKDRSGFLLHANLPLPRTLQPGEYVIDWMDDFSNLEPEDITELSAYDSIGKVYKAHKRDLAKVIEELKKRGLGKRAKKE